MRKATTLELPPCSLSIWNLGIIPGSQCRRKVTCGHAESRHRLRRIRSKISKTVFHSKTERYNVLVLALAHMVRRAVFQSQSHVRGLFPSGIHQAAFVLPLNCTPFTWSRIFWHFRHVLFLQVQNKRWNRYIACSAEIIPSIEWKRLRGYNTHDKV